MNTYLILTLVAPWMACKNNASDWLEQPFAYSTCASAALPVKRHIETREPHETPLLLIKCT